MAAAARMTTTGTTRMSIGTSIATVSFTVFHNGIVQVHNAEAIGTGALHLGNSRHWGSPEQFT